MNTKLIFWIVGVLLGTIIIAAVWYFFFPKPAPPATEPITTLPISGSVTPVTSSPRPSFATSSPAAGTMALATQDGIVTVKDFIHNGATISDKTNAERYLLAGNLGYCIIDPQQCQAATTTNFSVYYNSTAQSFIITLTEEPIGQARLDAEQFMFTTLGLTKQQMCSLNYLVGVTKYVSEQYAWDNLGFSFCPGATPLPK